MRKDQTRAEWLNSRKIHAPPAAPYWVLLQVAKLLARLDGTRFTCNAHPGREEGPIVMIANHASRNDYEFTGPPCWPKRLNYWNVHGHLAVLFVPRRTVSGVLSRRGRCAVVGSPDRGAAPRSGRQVAEHRLPAHSAIVRKSSAEQRFRGAFDELQGFALRINRFAVYSQTLL